MIGLDAEQRRVLGGMVAAALVTLVTVAVGPRYWPVELPADRLVFALRCDVFVVAWIAVGIARVASGRFRSPADIAGSAMTEATPAIRRAQAFLQNSLEQAALAVPVHLALATLLPVAHLGAIPLLVLLFAVGRIAFWAGYAGGAGSRAFGFALTFYPTVAALAWAIVLIVRGT